MYTRLIDRKNKKHQITPIILETVSTNLHNIVDNELFEYINYSLCARVSNNTKIAFPHVYRDMNVNIYRDLFKKTN